MSVSKYICTHCGKRFEAEEKEILECPGCFWSSSVKKEDEATDEKRDILQPQESPKKKPTFQLPDWNWKLILGSSIFLILIFFLRGPTASFLSQFTSQGKKSSDQKIRISIDDTQDISSSDRSPWDELTDASMNVLERRVNFSAERSPSPAELEVLGRRAPFQTGIIEKLPSQTWSLETYKKLITEQETFYKVPLPKSYKRKLYARFEEVYVPGRVAFEQGDLRQARDAWVQALVFPIYANDPSKHRGVVLTMLRPFITDTLSKIGAINHILAERVIRSKEQEISLAYEQLLNLSQKKSWKEASAVVLTLNQKIDALEQPSSLMQQTPAYPPVLHEIDPGIQATLMDLHSVPSAAIADFGPLRYFHLAFKAPSR